jgi:hypothetical protein
MRTINNRGPHSQYQCTQTPPPDYGPAFLKLDGFPGQVAVQLFSLDGTIVNGQVSGGTFTIVKDMDHWSPQLQTDLFQGKLIRTAEVTLADASGNKLVNVVHSPVFTFTNLLCHASVELAGHEVPQESDTFLFQTCCISNPWQLGLRLAQLQYKRSIGR